MDDGVVGPFCQSGFESMICLVPCFNLFVDRCITPKVHKNNFVGFRFVSCK